VHSQTSRLAKIYAPDSARAARAVGARPRAPHDSLQAPPGVCNQSIARRNINGQCNLPGRLCVDWPIETGDLPNLPRGDRASLVGANLRERRNAIETARVTNSARGAGEQSRYATCLARCRHCPARVEKDASARGITARVKASSLATRCPP